MGSSASGGSSLPNFEVNVIIVAWSQPCYRFVAKLCPTLCDCMDCTPPGSSVSGILQARILEWVAMPSSRGSSQPRDWTQISHTTGGCCSRRSFWLRYWTHVSCIASGFFTTKPPGNPAGGFFTVWATKEVHQDLWSPSIKKKTPRVILWTSAAGPKDGPLCHQWVVGWVKWRTQVQQRVKCFLSHKILCIKVSYTMWHRYYV